MIRRARPLLGTWVEIALPSGYETAFERAFAAMSRIHALMSFHQPDSDLGQLRRAAAGSYTKVAPETAEVLSRSTELYHLTDGLFDIAVGRRLVLTGFLPRAGLPNLHHFVGTVEDLQITDDHHVYQRRIPLLDLGGIAKGYAVDQAVAALVAQDVPHGLVNAGGDLRVFGARSQPVSIRCGSGELLELGMVRDLAVATSANRESRRRRNAQVTTPHIAADGSALRIDGAVSTCARSAMTADAMTKVAAIDPDLAGRLLEREGGRVLLRRLVGPQRGGEAAPAIYQKVS
jgi:thiamine biosynthesis lipoprotein